MNYVIFDVTIHQFDIRGLFFAMGSGHELGMKEPIMVISDNVKIITLEKALELSSNIVDFTSLHTQDHNCKQRVGKVLSPLIRAQIP